MKTSDDTYINRINLPGGEKNILRSMVKIPALTCSLFSLGLVLLISFNWVSASSTQNSADHISLVREIETDQLAIRNPVGLGFSQKVNANGSYAGIVDLPVEFNGSGPSDVDATISAYEWDFGDGNRGTRVNSTHSYAAFGINPVVLTVTDDVGGTATDTTSAVIQTESNQAPSVYVGSDQTITLADSVFLEGLVSDDGLPSTPGALTAIWSQLSGPGTVTFSNEGEFLTTATFSVTGTYVLRLTVSDGELSGSDDLTITINAAPPNTIRIPQDYPTIQAGIDAAQVGDLVLVSPGTYSENLYVAKTITLASTFYTTGDSSLIDQTIISSPDSLTETINVSSGAGPETKIIGFTIRDGKDGIKIRGKIKVLNNHLIDQATDAVDFSSGAAGLVQNNIMENNGDDAVDNDNANALIIGNQMLANGEGVEIRASNHSGPQLTIIIRNNTITDSLKSGLQLIDTDTIADTAALIVIDHNLIANSAHSGLSLMDNSVTSDDYRAASLLERIHLFNNTFVGNLYGAHGGDNLIAINNIFVDHTNIAVKEIDGASVVSSNLFWNNGTDNQGSNLDIGTTLFADPLLDAEYQLQPGSPAIDTGTALFTLPSGETVLDIAPGEYFGGAPDLGKYESNFGSSGNIPPAVDAGPDQSITLPTLSVNLVGTVSDDGNPDPPGATTSTWSQVSGTPGVEFGNPNDLETSATFPGTGAYVLRLTADDSEFTSSDDIVFTVNPPAINQAPIVDAGPNQTISLANSANLNGNVTDDGLPDPPGEVSTNWTEVSGPGQVSFADVSALDTAANFSNDGVYVLRLIADDSEHTNFDEVTITVHSSPNQPPNVDAGTNLVITLPDTAVLDGTVTDDSLPDPPGSFTTLWSVVSGPGLVNFADASAVDTTASFSMDGIYELLLSADDSEKSSFDSILITVNPAPVTYVWLPMILSVTSNR